MGPLCPCPNSKKPMKKVPGASHGPPTDPGPSGSVRASKWRGPKVNRRNAVVPTGTD
ncbi:unnamed protein product [Staurois parvus]|uniref:Uncharacterized protein n=1 Tax=Staurois parvus TaxID=386267 RepID=A0ABN9CUH7_9NEOB|nr:unnamed protein product [Staurois parvus]